MNVKFSEMLRSGMALLLALCMAVGLIPATVFAAEVEDVNDDAVINYVSLGASNVNGYGMHGYLDEDIYKYPLLKEQANIYGYKQDTPGSYPVLIKEYFEAQGKTVNLSQLAISSMRAEEVRFLLDDSYKGDAYTDWRFCDIPGYDGRSSQNWFYLAGKLEWEAQGNPGTPSQEEAVAALKAAYRQAITEADLITVDIGINNFGVYASNQIVSNMYENDLSKLDPELAAIYADGKAYVMDLLMANGGAALEAMPVESLNHMADTMAYALVGFCLSFDSVMAQIKELNPDATVVVVSIQNLMHGLDATMPGMDGVIPFGDMFGALTNAANVYTAAVSPYVDSYIYADVRQNGHVEFFSDELLAYNGDPATLSVDMRDCFDVYDNDLYIKARVQQILAKQLYLAGLLDISAVPAGYDIVGNLEHFALAYMYGLLKIPALGNATLEQFLDAGAAGALPAVAKPYYDGYVVALNTAHDVMAEIMQAGVALTTLDATCFGQNFGPVEDALLGAFFGTLENAVMAAIADPTFQFNLDDYYPQGIYKELAAMAGLPEGFVNTVAIMGIRTGIGNSFYGHPDGNGHVELKNKILAAIENDTTGKEVAIKEALALIAEYYDEAYAFAYQYAKGEGHIDAAVAEIDGVIAQLKALDVSDTQMTDEFKAELAVQIAKTIEALEAAKALLLEADVLDQATLDALIALLEEANDSIAHLLHLLEQAGVDVTELYIKPVLIPAIIENLKAAVKAGTEYLLEKMEEAFDALVEALVEQVKEAAPEAADWVYNWLYNNPEKVIGFFREHGDEMADFLAEYGDEAAMVLGYLLMNYGEEVAEFVMNNADEILVTMVKWFEVHGENTWELIKVYLDELGITEAVKGEMSAILDLLQEKLEAILPELEAKLQELKAELENASGELAQQLKAAIAELEAKIAEIKAALAEIENALKQMYLNAIHGEYTIDPESYYIALGDGTAAGKSYVDMLAGEMEALRGYNYGYSNLAKNGLMIEEIYNVLLSNPTEIAKADLITLGFGNNGFTNFAVENMMALINEIPVELDWSVYVGEEGVPYVEKILSELYVELEESGFTGTYMGVNITDLLAVAIESYAYSYVAYSCNLPEAVNAIHSINPEAQVIVVGMYNPLAGVVVDLDGTELAIGEYVQYVVDAANVSALAFAMITNDAIYVDAPAVETLNTKTEMTALQLITEFLVNKAAKLNPSENGHAYITEQILNALTIHVVGLLGDADNNGEVNTMDALLVLQYYTGAITESDLVLGVCDVDGDGIVNTLDALLILQFYTGAIDKFPIEN